MFRAIGQFIDLQDNNHRYQPGDVFPRAGLTVSAVRLRELSTGINRLNKPVIMWVDDKAAEKPEEKPEETGKQPVPDDFMNPPVIEPEDAEKAEEKKPKEEKAKTAAKPRRGRKKKTDVD